MLNIPSSVDDPSYRYKMPRIISKKEGRGNGSKTGIMNMGDVARAVKRDPVYLTKFFGYELGAQSSYTNKESEGERVVINGHHDTPVFQNMVDKFIDKYVLCVGCHLPEIDMVVKKGVIVATCKACGWNGDLDNGHKLASYILKNPPGTGIGFDGDKSKKTKEERQKERAEKAKKKSKDEDDETASYQSEDEKKDKKSKKEKKDKDEDGEKKEKKEKKAKKEKKSKKDDDDDEDGEEDGEVKEKKSKKEKKDKKDKKEKKDKKDKKEKKDKKDKKEKKEKSKGLDVDSDDEEKDSDKDSDAEEEELKYDDEVMSEIVRDVTAIVKASPKITKDKLFEEVRTLQVTKLFDHKLRMYVVVSALYPEASLKADGITSKKKFLNEFIQNAKMSFADWIWGFEAYLAQNPTATKAWPMALKALYDEDLAEEEHILEYYKEDRDNPGFDISKKAAGPFLKWLQTANDSDSDDDDDSDEDSD